MTAVQQINWSEYVGDRNPGSAIIVYSKQGMGGPAEVPVVMSEFLFLGEPAYCKEPFWTRLEINVVKLVVRHGVQNAYKQMFRYWCVV